MALTEQAGVLPRSVELMFDHLHLQFGAEFAARMSYLEIYNEELCDLLAEEGGQRLLGLYDDTKGGLTVDNLLEVPVRSTEETLTYMAMAVKRRKVAETQMNKMSSRSHTIFTLQIHVKDAQEGDVVRIGKLNLVDLAGSECIGRSGAEKMRAKEAGMINQSLLTLGRVITALVDHTGHIPYRDSKLTRLLQDTLGGPTKTCIVATVSPSSLNIEETLSTLDYAHRAKNIQNTPQVNQKVTKKVMIRGLNVEIEKLQGQLQAAKEKSGVRLAYSEYMELQARAEGQEAELGQLEERLHVLRSQRDSIHGLFAETTVALQTELAEHARTRAAAATAE